MPAINILLHKITSSKTCSHSNRHAEMHYKIFVFLYAILPGSLQRDDLKDCKTFTSYGYGYREAHEYRGANIPQNYVFLLDFYVKTVSDAHVLLQSDRSGSDSIEIVIGGGSNTFSQIRWLVYDEKRTILTQKTENILSPDNYRKFQITADTQGVLTVRAGDDEFLSWKFDKLFPIKYFAFGSWTNTKGTWKYGCNHQTDFTDTEIFTTDLERLKNDLLTFYNPNTIPCNSSETLEIQVRFHIHTVSLNESRGELIIRGESMLKWQDAKLKWKPDEYGGINTLYLPPFQVWTPPLKTLNVLAIHKDYLLSETEAGLLVRHNGSIFWRPPFKSVSMCQVSIASYPKDIHTCSVYIGFWMEPKNLKLTIINPNEKMENVRTGSVWRILKATAVKGRDEEGNDNYGVLYVELQRHVYLITENVVNVSLIVSLVSFFIPLHYSTKFYLSCSSAFLFFAAAVTVDKDLPIKPAEVPKILNKYNWLSLVGVFPILVFTLLMNFPRKLWLPNFLERAIHSNQIDWFFQFSQRDVRIYGNLNRVAAAIERRRINAMRLQSIVQFIFFVIYVILIILAIS